MARVGILGGTFNPPHVGHMVCATEALDQLGLERVVLVPAREPPHKEVPEDPGIGVRLELCRLACEGEPRLTVSDVEARREGPSYTVDTLRALRDERPGDELTFIVGGDMAASFGRWREPGEILTLCRLGVAERGDVRRGEILEGMAGLPGAVERLDFFDMPRIDVSSSLLRRRAAEGRTLRWLAPDAVARHVAATGLYRVGAKA